MNKKYFITIVSKYINEAFIHHTCNFRPLDAVLSSPLRVQIYSNHHLVLNVKSRVTRVRHIPNRGQ